MEYSKYIDNRKCCVEFCQNTGQNCDLTFFLVPRNDPARAEQWLKGLKLKPDSPKKKFICSDHFELKYFTNTLKRKLHFYAFPTLQFKSPKIEIIAETTSDECKGSHFICSESSKDVQSDSKEGCVVPTVHLLLEDQPQIQPVTSTCTEIQTEITEKDRNAIKQTVDDYLKKRHSVNKKAIEKELEDYIKKRYYNERNRKAFEQMIKDHQIKKSTKRFLNKYGKESGQSQDIVIKTEKEDSNSSVENQPHISQEENSTASKNLSSEEERTNLKQPTNFISILKQNVNNSKNVSKHLCEERNLHPSASYLQSLTKDSNRTITHENTNSTLIPQILTTKTSNISSLETGNVYDKFAVRIAEELKRMKNPYRRARTLFNIEKVLFEAKSGVYDA